MDKQIDEYNKQNDIETDIKLEQIKKELSTYISDNINNQT